MARRALGPRYFASRRAYFTTFRGQPRKLAEGPDDAPTGPTYLAALAAFQELMQLANAPSAGDKNTVATVCELYARHLEAQGRAKSLRLFLDTTTHAVEAFGTKPVRELVPYDITQWLERMRKPRRVFVGAGRQRTARVVSWGESYRVLALKNLRTALNWAAKQGLLKTHCLQVKGAVDVGPGHARGAEARLPEDVQARVLAAAGSRLRDLLTFLAGTGCRPAEAYHLEARYFCRADSCVVYRHNAQPPDYIHKTARKAKRDRIIYLTPELAELVGRLCERHPSGPLFRSRYGKPWYNGSVSNALNVIRKKLDITTPLTAYSWRHTFATQFLERRGSIKLLADLMGTSVSMIEKHYGHGHDDRRAMRQALLSVLGAAG